MGLCDRCKERVCAKERESIPIVKRRKRRGEGVHLGATEEGIYSAVKVTLNGTNVLCKKERWEEADGPGL